MAIVLSEKQRLAQVYEAIRPVDGSGSLLWESLGPETIKIIHEHIEIDRRGAKEESQGNSYIRKQAGNGCGCEYDAYTAL